MLFLLSFFLVCLCGCHHLQLRCSKVSRKEGNPFLGSVLLGLLSCRLWQQFQWCHHCGRWGNAKELHEAPAELYHTEHKHTQTTGFMRQISTNYTKVDLPMKIQQFIEALHVKPQTTVQWISGGVESSFCISSFVSSLCLCCTHYYLLSWPFIHFNDCIHCASWAY